MPRKKARKKHIPQRTCVGCREVLSKRSLIRIVRIQDRVVIDPSGKLNGRGAYLHERVSCWEKGLKGPLAHALKIEIQEKDRKELLAYIADLPPE